MRAGLVGIVLEQLEQLCRRVQEIARLLECQGKVVARVARIGLERQRQFIGRKALLPIAHLVGRQALVVIGFKVTGIRSCGRGVGRDRLRQLAGLLRFDSFRKIGLGVAPMAGSSAIRVTWISWILSAAGVVVRVLSGVEALLATKLGFVFGGLDEGADLDPVAEADWLARGTPPTAAPAVVEFRAARFVGMGARLVFATGAATRFVWA